MKKIFALFLAVIMTLSLTACGGETKNKEIQLTTDNISNYLAFEFDYSKVERENTLGISFGYTDITMKSFAVSAGSFDNVEITVEIPLTNGWSVSSSDKAYDENNSEMVICSFRLPASGEYTDTHDLIAAMVYKDPDSSNIKYTITSVSGTFTPSK